MFSSSTHGWRLGLQAMALLCAGPFILGTFYRSATLYHPQRRAILHLKSQKRKITIKNGHGRGAGEVLSLRSLACLRRNSVRAAMAAAVAAAAGAYSPLVYLVSDICFQIIKDI